MTSYLIIFFQKTYNINFVFLLIPVVVLFVVLIVSITSDIAKKEKEKKARENKKKEIEDISSSAEKITIDEQEKQDRYIAYMLKRQSNIEQENLNKKKTNAEEQVSFKNEENLKDISGYLLFFGIFLILISFFATVIIRDMRYTSFVSYTYDWSFERVLSALIPAIGILIISIVTRIFLKVISEISISLKKIRMRKTI